MLPGTPSYQPTQRAAAAAVAPRHGGAITPALHSKMTTHSPGYGTPYTAHDGGAQPHGDGWRFLDAVAADGCGPDRWAAPHCCPSDDRRDFGGGPQRAGAFGYGHTGPYPRPACLPAPHFGAHGSVPAAGISGARAPQHTGGGAGSTRPLPLPLSRAKGEELRGAWRAVARRLEALPPTARYAYDALRAVVVPAAAIVSGDDPAYIALIFGQLPGRSLPLPDLVRAFVFLLLRVNLVPIDVGGRHLDNCCRFWVPKGDVAAVMALSERFWWSAADGVFDVPAEAHAWLLSELGRDRGVDVDGISAVPQLAKYFHCPRGLMKVDTASNVRGRGQGPVKRPR